MPHNRLSLYYGCILGGGNECIMPVVLYIERFQPSAISACSLFLLNTPLIIIFPTSFATPHSANENIQLIHEFQIYMVIHFSTYCSLSELLLWKKFPSNNYLREHIFQPPLWTIPYFFRFCCSLFTYERSFGINLLYSIFFCSNIIWTNSLLIDHTSYYAE